MSEKRGFNKKEENKKIWMIVAVIMIAVLISGIILGEALSRRSANDKNAINLIQESGGISSGGKDSKESEKDSNKDSDKDFDKESKKDSDKEKEDNKKESETDEEIHASNNGDRFVPYLDVELSDGDGVWTTNTDVSIFELSYENGQALVTVEGNGDEVIAPGTENTYTFYLKNNSNVAIDYNLEIASFFTPLDQLIPVKVRLKGYDGSYLLGSEDQWEDVEKLNDISEWVTIGVNSYAYYTLEWMWPFESGDDNYDTYLGDLSIDDTLELTINIQTVSTVSANMNATGGLPQTGDSMNIALYGGLLAGSAIVIFILIFLWRRKDEEEDEA